MSTANLFRLAQRRLSAGSNPFEGKLFYVNPSYRRPQLDTDGYSWEVDRSDSSDRCDRCDGLMFIEMSGTPKRPTGLLGRS